MDISHTPPHGPHMFDTDFPADSIEFCPHPGLQNVFACGTYKLEQDGQLNPAGQKRIGQCLVFEMQQADTFRKIQQFDLPAVLDMKWSHAEPVLAIADAHGQISLHAWHEEQNQSVLRQIGQVACTDVSAGILALSLDWSNRRSKDSGSLIVSLSNGSLSLLQPENGTGELRVTESWHAHDYEPWIAAWDYWNTNVVFSGGDDLKFKGWDIRQPLSSPIFTNKRFDGGITTIQSHPHRDHILALGSYDSNVRLFDTRKPLVPLTQVDVGGGAWRVKWHPSDGRQNDLLVACMHDGFKVVRFAEDQSSQIVQRFDKHESLAYGADWSHSSVGSSETTVASCSFYDHAMYVWRA